MESCIVPNFKFYLGIKNILELLRKILGKNCCMKKENWSHINPTFNALENLWQRYPNDPVYILGWGWKRMASILWWEVCEEWEVCIKFERSVVRGRRCVWIEGGSYQLWECASRPRIDQYSHTHKPKYTLTIKVNIGYAVPEFGTILTTLFKYCS